MHYFQFNIGDYASHTRHLSPIEDLAYRRMIDLYYLHERPLNECSTTVQRQIGMREYPTEVDAVLSEFFILEEGIGWVSKRIEDDIAAYKAKREVAVKAGQASGRARSHGSSKPSNDRSTTVQRPLIDRSTDVEPTKNQEPRNQGTKVQTPRAGALGVYEEGFQAFWQAYGHKIGKHAAEKAWASLKPTGAVLESILAKAKATSDANPSREFYQHPATWLNGRHWQDEVIPTRGGAPKRRVADGGDWTGNSEPIQEF